MNRIVKTHYPVEKLPEDLRAGLPAGAEVTVTLDLELEEPHGALMSVDEILSALPEDKRRSGEQIDADFRRQRDAWDR